MISETSVIVLTHNRLAVTKKFFQLLFSFTKNFRLILVDNNSTDGTAIFLRNLKERHQDEVVLIELEENQGVAGGRNHGYQEVKSDYFICLDNDQFVYPNWLEELYELSKNFEFAATETWLLCPPNSVQEVVVGGRVMTRKDYFPIRKSRRKEDKYSYGGGGGTLIRTEAARALEMPGGNVYDNQFSPLYFEDGDLSFRAHKQEMKTGWHYKSKIVHLGNQTSATQKDYSRMEQFNKSWELFRKKWYPYYPEPFSMVQHDCRTQ